MEAVCSAETSIKLLFEATQHCNSEDGTPSCLYLSVMTYVLLIASLSIIHICDILQRFLIDCISPRPVATSSFIILLLLAPAC
jgi:hypothetical protein